MFVASYVTDYSLEDIRDTASNAGYSEGTELGAALVAIARGFVVCVSHRPGVALHTAVEMLINEIAEGYEIEPDTLRDCHEVIAVRVDVFNGVEYLAEAVVVFEFEDYGGDMTTVTAGVAIDQFKPI